MQPVTGYASPESLLELAPGKVRPTPEHAQVQQTPEHAQVRQTPEDAPQPDDGAPTSSDEMGVPLGYTSSARTVAMRATTSGNISILA